MPDLPTLLLFAGACLALLVVPGPAVLFIVARTVAQGRSAGLVTVAGVHTGSVVHVIGATVGLSALLASSATAFSIVKYAGAAYLVWLGVRQWRRAGAGFGTGADAPPPASNRRLFGEGVVVNVLNPKTAIFFLAFLPQFVDPARGPVWVQVLLFGLCFIVLGMLSDGAYALLAGTLSGRLGRSRRSHVAMGRTGGLVCIGLGVGAAVAGEPARV